MSWLLAVSAPFHLTGVFASGDVGSPIPTDSMAHIEAVQTSWGQRVSTLRSGGIVAQPTLRRDRGIIAGIFQHHTVATGAAVQALRMGNIETVWPVPSRRVFAAFIVAGTM